MPATASTCKISERSSTGEGRMTSQRQALPCGNAMKKAAQPRSAVLTTKNFFGARAPRAKALELVQVRVGVTGGSLARLRNQPPGTACSGVPELLDEKASPLVPRREGEGAGPLCGGGDGDSDTVLRSACLPCSFWAARQCGLWLRCLRSRKGGVRGTGLAWSSEVWRRERRICGASSKKASHTAEQKTRE
mmetsp:Transcript_63801/g.183265  ORF Transcript_63801/g.183265 Transcript_63801/m.183265 type:complete len:191 (+) Transcript_63801:281-853(+)